MAFFRFTWNVLLRWSQYDINNYRRRSWIKIIDAATESFILFECSARGKSLKHSVMVGNLTVATWRTHRQWAIPLSYEVTRVNIWWIYPIRLVLCKTFNVERLLILARTHFLLDWYCHELLVTDATTSHCEFDLTTNCPGCLTRTWTSRYENYRQNSVTFPITRPHLTLF